MSTHRLLLIALLFTAPLRAQSPDTLVVHGDSIVHTIGVRDYGYVAFPITALLPLGATFTVRGDRLEVSLFGRTLWFRPGYGTFAENGVMMSLHYTAFERGGLLYLPAAFFTEWLPGRYHRHVHYDRGTRTLARPEQVISTAPAAAPRSRATWDSLAAGPLAHRLTTEPLFRTDEPALASAKAPEPRRSVVARRPTTAEAYVRLSGWYADNFFQAPADVAPTELKATTGEARLVLRMGGPRLNLHARASHTMFERFDPSVTAAGGLDWSGGPHSIEVNAGRQTRSPRLMGGDQTGFANTTHGAATYGLMLPGRLQASALAHHYDVYVHARDATYRLDGLGGALRWRSAGSRFSPEVGYTQSQWRAAGPAEEYDEATRWISVRAVPVSTVYLHVRYRQDVRSYAVPDPSASNFGREDTRLHWTVAADIRLTRRLAWGIYYTFEDGRSTRPDRTFSGQSLTSGLSLRVW